MTLQTIADALGVSRTTVSNAYNRPDQLAPELRRKVLEIAKELGYAGPDPAARRLRSGRRGAIGLMFSERLSYAFTDPGVVGFLQGLTEATEAKGYELLLLPGMRGKETEVVAVRDAVVGAFCLYCMPDTHPAVGRGDEPAAAGGDRRRAALAGRVLRRHRRRGGRAAGRRARRRARPRAGRDRRRPADRRQHRGPRRPRADRAEQLQGQPRAARRLPGRPRRDSAGRHLRGLRQLRGVRRPCGAGADGALTASDGAAVLDRRARVRRDRRAARGGHRRARRRLDHRLRRRPGRRCSTASPPCGSRWWRRGAKPDGC